MKRCRYYRKSVWVEKSARLLTWGTADLGECCCTARSSGGRLELVAVQVLGAHVLSKNDVGECRVRGAGRWHTPARNCGGNGRFHDVRAVDSHKTHNTRHTRREPPTGVCAIAMQKCIYSSALTTKIGRQTTSPASSQHLRRQSVFPLLPARVIPFPSAPPQSDTPPPPPPAHLSARTDYVHAVSEKPRRRGEEWRLCLRDSRSTLRPNISVNYRTRQCQ